MDALQIINAKRECKELSFSEIEFMVNGYVNDTIPDYQMSAFLMAICINGLSIKETTYLTKVMVNSGETIDLSFLKTTVVDKHSTGGVGDKISLIVLPIVASLGIPVAKMSGRGLGHTGGTIDKLESFKGFRTELSEDEFKDIVRNNGLSIIGQSENIVPADKKLYALRDVTGTVNSIPLIASSIMSKKIALGANAIILDIKVGKGAFMKDIESAELLAHTMIGIGKELNKKVVAVLTRMDQPLGYEIGNAMEVKEAIILLKNYYVPQDLFDVSVEIASQMICLSDPKIKLSEAKERVLENINNGKAYDKLVELIHAQGGDIESLTKLTAKYETHIKSKIVGHVTQIDTQKIGNIVGLLGAGRLTKEDKIDHSAGITIHVKLGDRITKDDILFTVNTNQPLEEHVIDELHETIATTALSIEKLPTVIKVIS